MGDNLLGAQGHPHGFFGREPERLIHAVGVEGLGAAQHRCQRLEGDPYDIILRLLCGQGRAGCLGVEAQRPGPRVPVP